jgi:hypothetical protein
VMRGPPFGAPLVTLPHDADQLAGRDDLGA